MCGTASGTCSLPSWGRSAHSWRSGACTTGRCRGCRWRNCRCHKAVCTRMGISRSFLEGQMAQGSLSPQDLDHLRAELAEGRQPAVWFTSAAVGVEAGRSAKVIAFTEPEEGDFIQVRPTGERDEISFSPAELTVEKPPRKKAVAVKPPVKEPEPPKPVEIGHVYTPAPPVKVE